MFICLFSKIYLLLIKNEDFIARVIVRTIYILSIKENPLEISKISLLKIVTAVHFLGFLVILPLYFFASFFSIVPTTCRVACAVLNICHSLIGGFQLAI